MKTCISACGPSCLADPEMHLSPVEDLRTHAVDVGHRLKSESLLILIILVLINLLILIILVSWSDLQVSTAVAHLCYKCDS